MPPFHSRAAIVSIGDELSLGQNLDTNSKWLAERLMRLGIITLEHVTVGDDEALTAESFSRLARRADVLISTGGLGPTLDDLTRQSLARVLREPLVTDDDALHTLQARFAARGRTVPDLQRAQAARPATARMLPNPNGTAPGLHAVLTTSPAHATDVFCLPGPPGEMKPMFESHVLPALCPPHGRRASTRFIHLAGIGEGDAAARLGSLMDRARMPIVGITASGGILTCRVRYEGSDDDAAVRSKIDETVSAIRHVLGPHIFGQADDTIMTAVLAELASRNETLASVESCTGGMLGQIITDAPGASRVYLGGLVTYSNDLKAALADVPRDLIAAHGAVSEPVARAMALGGLHRSGAARCLAITGIAGPHGGTPAKPIGTVFISLASRRDHAPADVLVRHFAFTGQRADIRQRAATTALVMLLFELRGSLSGLNLLWQVPAGA
ncbi:MAG: CinA family nicotinamide mononucleotide deamidase-related protein [Phycisphaerales bacterium]